MNILNSVERHLNMLAALILAGAMLLLITGCGEVDGGTVQNEIQLPLDSVLNFNCEDEGIFPDDCVLENPENPYASANVSEDTKFELNDGAPSAKSRYYLWATALARQASGENQYYTALSLHEVYAESASPTTREQAIKAYRSVLDNFFLSATFFVVPVTTGDVPFAVSIKDIVGENLHNPTAASLVSLYSDPIFALEDISEWGYVYDPASGIMSIFR